MTLFPLLFGLRSYIRFFKRWLKMSSVKYNAVVLFTGLLILARSTWSYTRGYLKGLKKKMAA